MKGCPPASQSLRWLQVGTSATGPHVFCCQKGTQKVTRSPSLLCPATADRPTPVAPLSNQTHSSSASHLAQQPHSSTQYISSQERQQQKTSLQAASLASEGSVAQPPCDPLKYDMCIWHYKPWWCQPYTIVLTGVAFVVGANLICEPGIQTTAAALAPVSLWWYIFLWVMPQQFKQFAVKYLETHNEVCTLNQLPVNNRASQLDYDT